MTQLYLVFSSFFHRVFSQICKNDKNVFFPLNMHDFLPLNDVCTYIAPERHWPRKRVWGCALKTPFSHLFCSSQGSHFKQKSQFTRPPFEKILKFNPLYSLNFCPNFSSQATKFGNFQLTSPLIWKFSVHKPPLSEPNISSQAPHFGNPGCTGAHPTWKKLSAPRDIAWFWKQHNYVIYFYKDDIQLQIQLPPCWCGLPSVIKVEHGNENNSSY